MARREGIENPYVKKCALPVSPPKAFGHDIQTGSIFSVGSSVSQLLPCYWLETWLCTNIVAYFTEEVSRDVSEFVVSDRWESSSGATHRVLNRELFAADAVGRQVWRAPTIPQTEGIPEGALVEGKPVLSDWQDREPAGSAFLLGGCHSSP